MASSSSSSYRYQVFLSFRGEDTRLNFTGHLHRALRTAGINTFIDDDELPRGEAIRDELLRAIQRSRVSIIVFSRRYGDSSWCLNELVEIMNCRRTVRQIVLPIFYDVDPSDVRKQSGSFGEAFGNHEKRFASDLEKVLRWREALAEAADLSGWDLRNTLNGHEAKFIEEIVKCVSKKLNCTNLFVASYPIGIESRVGAVNSKLDVKPNDKACVGIWGMGGVGKTTIAKAIYNQTYNGTFAGRSFLANVREKWIQPNGPVLLQEQLLSDILKPGVHVGSVDQGINMIKERLSCLKVLILVDDVNHIKQLNALARHVWFGPGRNIVQEKFPEEPEKWSRLWSPKDISDVLRKQTGTKYVEGLTLNVEEAEKVSFSTTAFIKMRRLRLLQLNHVQLNGSYEYLSEDLRWLCWHGFPLKFIPNNFYLGNLVALDLQYSNLAHVWEEPKLLEKLKILNLSHSRNLRRTPDFSYILNLEQLIMINCESLEEVHDSIGLLEKLVLVNLEGCTSLKKLPTSFGKLKSLITLIFSGCPAFENSGDSDLWPSRIMRRLVPTWLKELYLMQFNMTDDAIPKELGSLPSLEILEISKSNVRNLPNLDGLSYLKHFLLDACDRLQSIPDLPKKLEYISVVRCGQLKRVPDMSRMPDLFILALIDCVNLVGVPGLNKLSTKSLGDLFLSNSSMPTLHEAIIWEIINKRCYNILNTHLVGDDIPRGFTFINKGSSVCFEVPEWINCKLEGLAYCILYSYVDRGHVSSKRPSLLLKNHTKQHLVTISSSMNLYPYRNNQLWVRLVKDGFHDSEEEPQHLKLECGDKFMVMFSPGGSNMIVEKIGVFLLLENETNSVYDGTVLMKNLTVLTKNLTVLMKNLTSLMNKLTVLVENLPQNLTVRRKNLTVRRKNLTVRMKNLTVQMKNLTVQMKNLTFLTKNLIVITSNEESYSSNEESYSSNEESYSCSDEEVISKTRIVLLKTCTILLTTTKLTTKLAVRSPILPALSKTLIILPALSKTLIALLNILQIPITVPIIVLSKTDETYNSINSHNEEETHSAEESLKFQSMDHFHST